MKNILLTFFLVFISNFAQSQIPKTGTYFYAIRFAESPNLKNSKADCKIIIEGEKIKVIYLGGNILKAKKGDILDEGVIMKHKSGSWIIGKKESDKKLKEVGGCTNGPREIDFKKKEFWMC